MYLQTHLIPTNKDEWIINLHISDGTKVEARLIRGYKEALQATKVWSTTLSNCKFTVGGIEYNDASK